MKNTNSNMKIKLILIVIGAAGALAACAQPSLTIYNQNFAVVRDSVPLDLKAGDNAVVFPGATAQVEPDSVILRDPTGQRSLQILEQNYRNDPVSEPLLLSLFEGKTIDFEKRRMKDNTEVDELIKGKIIRSGFVPGGQNQQPIIEVSSNLQFSCRASRCFPISAATRSSSHRSTGCCNRTSRANSTPKSATSPAALPGARATIWFRRRRATFATSSAGSR